MLDYISEVSKTTAVNFVRQYHYSEVMPRINKIFIGGFKDNKIVAVMVLGYGTRPLHTIRKMFPSLLVKDYLELGKLCVSEEMPKNTESTFIARCIKHIKQHYPERKVLFSWADGIIGKPGYVYQASNFYYGGKITTEMYIDNNGNRMHPRSFQGISPDKTGKFGCRSYEVTTKAGFTKLFGYQFRYVYPLCNKNEWKSLQETSPFNWQRCNYPKDNDCKWWKQTSKGKREQCDLPPFITTKYKKTIKDIVDVFF
jgi:hypothetical protein